MVTVSEVAYESLQMLTIWTVRMLLEDDATDYDPYQLILQGQDLACYQCGIDLDTDRLVWTRQFEKFIVTGQLFVTHIATPYQTAIRLVRAQSQFGCYCDLPTELSLLNTYVELAKAQKINVSGQIDGNTYGEFLVNPDVLEPYCSVISCPTDINSTDGNCNGMEFRVTSYANELLHVFQNNAIHLNSISLVEVFDRL